MRRWIAAQQAVNTVHHIESVDRRPYGKQSKEVAEGTEHHLPRQKTANTRLLDKSLRMRIANDTDRGATGRTDITLISNGRPAHR